MKLQVLCKLLQLNDALYALVLLGDSCENYFHPQHGKTGRCLKTSQCSDDGGVIVSKLCCPSIVPRATWKARAPKNITPLITPVSYVVIHHTYSASCTDEKMCLSKMKGIQDFHMDGKGWDDIGYNFVVGADGNAYEGRGWERVGAHCKGYNSRSI
ncbi:unnamed protein product, partial [Didymodactylos carnosus]